jgi:hypothetical protein
MNFSSPQSATCPATGVAHHSYKNILFKSQEDFLQIQPEDGGSMYLRNGEA